MSSLHGYGLEGRRLSPAEAADYDYVQARDDAEDEPSRITVGWGDEGDDEGACAELEAGPEEGT